MMWYWYFTGMVTVLFLQSILLNIGLAKGWVRFVGRRPEFTAFVSMTRITLVHTSGLDDLTRRLVGRSSHFLHLATPHSRFLQGKGKNERRKTKRCLTGCSTYLTLYSDHSTTDNPHIGEIKI